MIIREDYPSESRMRSLMTVRIPAIIRINLARNPHPRPQVSIHIMNWNWTPTILRTMDKNPSMNIRNPIKVIQPFFCMSRETLTTKQDR